MEDNSYVFTRSSRSAQAITWLVLWWLVLAVLAFALVASPIIVALLACASLPALYDIGMGATSELRITNADIIWRSGRRGGKLPRGQLKSVRLDTRLDLSLRMTLITHQGKKTRLPYECVPSARAIETALHDQGIPYERHHFTLMS